MVDRAEICGCVGLTSVGVADWDSTYRTLGPGLLAYLRKLARDDATAADLLQDCFIRAMSAGRVPDDSAVKPWLFRIATNLAIDHMRRERRLGLLRFRLRDTASSAERSIEESDHIRRALHSIPPEQAAALVLRIDRGLTTAEVAQAVGASHSATKARLARGRLNFLAAYRRIAGGSRG